MALTFENGNYILTCKEYLENKTTIKVQMFADIYPMKYRIARMFGGGGIWQIVRDSPN